MPRKKTKKNKSRKNNNKKNNKKDSLTHWIFILAVIVIISIGYYKYTKPTSPESNIAAIVNNEPITNAYLDEQYNNLPEAIQARMTKEDLLERLIDAKLLEQEASKQNIEVTDDEVQSEIELIKSQYESEEEFNTALSLEDISLADLETNIKNNLVIAKFINSTILSKLEVSKEEIKEFYRENKKKFEGLDLTIDELNDIIRQNLLLEKQQLALDTYLSQLRSKAVIQKDTLIVKPTFTDTKDETCSEDNKPIIRFYASTNCRSCTWIQGTFYEVVSEFSDSIVAHHWIMDKGDDGLTAEEEKGIPKQEFEIYKKYNPEKTLPTFVFGCSYVRIGNGHEQTLNLEAEKTEFRNIIEQLVNE